MAEQSKKVQVLRAGGTASVEVEVFPGDTVDQMIALVAPQLGYGEGGSFQLLSPAGKPIVGDLYKQVSDGDKLTLAQIGEGGWDREKRRLLLPLP